MNGTLRLSVAMCTYNGQRFLPAQLDSLLAQRRPPDELVICDDASADDTPDLLRHFAARAPSPVRLEFNPANLGLTANFEKAITLCTGQVIALCDQDDVWYPRKLERLERAFLDQPDLLMTFSDADAVNDDQQPLGYRIWQSLNYRPLLSQDAAGHHSLFRTLLRFNVVTGATAAFAASLRDLLLPIPSTWLHDGWIALLAASLGPTRPLDEPLIAYRQHTQQQIGGRKLDWRTQLARARAMRPDYFQRMAENFRLAGDRLASQHRWAVSADVLSLLRAKSRHAHTRWRMRRQSWFRWPLTMREAMRGNYHRFGYGWKSFAQDLLLW